MSVEPYGGTTPEQLRPPLVAELLSIHNHFRNEPAAPSRFGGVVLTPHSPCFDV